MSGYVAFYRGRRTEVWAESLWAAKVAATEFFGATPDTVMIAVRSDGSQVVHTADF